VPPWHDTSVWSVHLIARLQVSKRMSVNICSAIPRNGDTSNALMPNVRLTAKRCVFKSRLKRSDSTAGSRNESDSEFQTVGPATEKACRCQKYCDETAEYSVCWRPETWETGTQHSARYLGARYQ